jgi:hypothetical protein
MSTEHTVAAAWLANHQDAGSEGVVAKRATPAVPVGAARVAEDPHPAHR